MPVPALRAGRIKDEIKVAGSTFVLQEPIFIPGAEAQRTGDGEHLALCTLHAFTAHCPLGSAMTPSACTRLILASGSPRRRELLVGIVAGFEVVASGAEESGVEQPSREFPAIQLPSPYEVSQEASPMLWAWRKSCAVAQVRGSDPEWDTLVLGADTVVVAEDRILNKPRDRVEATEMLLSLAGREHAVITGWVLLLVPAGGDSDDPQLQRYGYTSSLVRMRPFDPGLISWYVESGEPFDKAGGYAVQGLGGRLVTEVQGCWNNVVGLPVCAVRAALGAIGMQVAQGFDWRGPCEGPYCTDRQH